MDDLISRQTAIEALDVGAELLRRVLDDAYVVGAEREKYKWGLELIESGISDIKGLPSAQQERKNGKWEEKEVIHEVEASTVIDEWQSARCSVCGKYHTTPYMYYFDEFNFCPNCGADMRDEEEID